MRALTRCFLSTDEHRAPTTLPGSFYQCFPFHSHSKEIFLDIILNVLWLFCFKNLENQYTIFGIYLLYSNFHILTKGHLIFFLPLCVFISTIFIPEKDFYSTLVPFCLVTSQFITTIYGMENQISRNPFCFNSVGPQER